MCLATLGENSGYTGKLEEENSWASQSVQPSSSVAREWDMTPEPCCVVATPTISGSQVPFLSLSLSEGEV
jgi:hypothetical protein